VDEDPEATRYRARPAPADGGAAPDDVATRRGAGAGEDASATRDWTPPAEVGETGQETLGGARRRAATPPPEQAVWSPPATPPPGPSRGGNLRLLVGAALVVVAGAGFAAGWFAHGSPAATPIATTVPRANAPFLVTSVSARRAAGGLACPSAVAHLTGTVTVDRGGGTITYDWVLPHHTVSAPATVTLSAGQSKAVVTLDYTISGNAALTGSATLHVISPLDAYSAPVALHYTCAKKP
jgi:hypothetical protein